ncbi:hypothetical protein BpHYR1_050235 [Brachionus plicatilis]|uniref:Uncharacterized protein n=1 Tax=Brachionus plicatilis TaxID=10195 RepID=A0A3M7RJY7_BRAPC|nr:hypothetical protein BpHYR1_050235 [Brachionus plicatilis]
MNRGASEVISFSYTIQHGHDRVTFINGDQKLASDDLESLAGNTRTCHEAIERELIRKLWYETQLFYKHDSGKLEHS